eukprot:365940-Chlamydomonas_euryale.AAC.15
MHVRLAAHLTLPGYRKRRHIIVATGIRILLQQLHAYPGRGAGCCCRRKWGGEKLESTELR